MKRDDAWIARIDCLKAKGAWTDVKVSRAIDISPAMLAHVRAGRRPLPVTARIRVLHALAEPMTHGLLMELLSPEAAELLSSTYSFRLVPCDDSCRPSQQ